MTRRRSGRPRARDEREPRASPAALLKNGFGWDVDSGASWPSLGGDAGGLVGPARLSRAGQGARGPRRRMSCRVEGWRGGRRIGELPFAGGFRLRAGASVRSMSPFPAPAHRTGRADFPHPALRWASRGSSRRLGTHRAAEPTGSELGDDPVDRELLCPARRHLVAASQGVAHALREVSFHRPVGEEGSAVAEVVPPAAEHPPELADHRGPGRVVPRMEEFPQAFGSDFAFS